MCISERIACCHRTRVHRGRHHHLLTALGVRFEHIGGSMRDMNEVQSYIQNLEPAKGEHKIPSQDIIHTHTSSQTHTMNEWSEGS